MDSPENFQIPDDIVNSWKQAVASKSRAAKNAVFQSFLRAGKDWSKFFGYTYAGPLGVCVILRSLFPILRFCVQIYPSLKSFDLPDLPVPLRLSIKCSKNRTDRTVGRKRFGLLVNVTPVAVIVFLDALPSLNSLK